MKLFFHWLVCLVLLGSCANPSNSNKDSQLSFEGQGAKIPKIKAQQILEGLVDIQAIDPIIQIDLKYASVDNFLHEKLYSRLNKAYLQKDVALRLSSVQKALSLAYPGYKLLIYDALRPVSVQQKMWQALDTLAPSERGKYVSNPKNLSLHNMGAAVDLTIIDSNGKALDMGAGFDDFRPIAYPNLEDSFLRTGQLTPLQVKNRNILRNAMQAQGFRQFPTEWWHYNACSRSAAKKKYKVYYTEP
jgi:D-alanyl-D-alanine dipeptidase